MILAPSNPSSTALTTSPGSKWRCWITGAASPGPDTDFATVVSPASGDGDSSNPLRFAFKSLAAIMFGTTPLTAASVDHPTMMSVNVHSKLLKVGDLLSWSTLTASMGTVAVVVMVAEAIARDSTFGSLTLTTVDHSRTYLERDYSESLLDCLSFTSTRGWGVKLVKK